MKRRTHLDPADLLKMQLVHASLEGAKARHALTSAEGRLARKTAECGAVQAQLQQVLAQVSAERKLAEAAAELEEAQAKQREMAGEVAKRYGVDWESTAFDSDTGQFMPLGN